MNSLTTMSVSDKEKFWRDYDWKSAEDSLFRTQQALTRAAIADDKTGITNLQKKIVRSFEAKMLAVRHICDSNAGPGVDGVRAIKPCERVDMAVSLTSKGYRAHPLRLVIIRPKGGKERNIKIPVLYDRAMQVLYGYSLMPVAEATGDRKSFAFRVGRGTNDAHAYVMNMFSGRNAPEWVVIADVKACYESISHDFLMGNIPMDIHVLREFLKAGFVFGGRLFPEEEQGISLGSSISPIFANMTLDGMQAAVFDALGIFGVRGEIEQPDYQNGNLVRFADDIIISARTEADTRKIIAALEDFLKIRGLSLSAKKTKIVSVYDGFDFLARNYKRVGDIMEAVPSEAAVTRFESHLQDFILSHSGSQKALIETLNRKLNGWAAYHKITSAAAAFRRVDAVVKALLLRLCENKHHSLSRDKIINRYFYLDADGEHVYALPDKSDVRVMSIGKTILTEHKPVSISKNPYLDADYFDARSDKREIENAVGKYKAVWTRQGGRCLYCGGEILPDQKRAVMAVDEAKPLSQKNAAYIHERCRLHEAAFYDADDYINSPADIHRVFAGLEHKERAGRNPKFALLKDYFHKQTAPSLKLTFKQIEDILRVPLCRSAYKFLDWWYRKGAVKISESWLANGYVIQHLDMDKYFVIFKRVDKERTALNIPDAFLSGKLPKNACCEVENFFEYIRKKYGF